jgi:hypothetical protein
MHVNYDALLLGSWENFERAFADNPDRSANYILEGKEHIDPEGNSIRIGVKRGLYSHYEERGVFWNGHLLIDETWFPRYGKINVANICRTIDESGTIRHGEIRDGKLVRGRMRLVSGMSYWGEFNTKEQLITGQVEDEEATLPDQVDPPPPFRLHLSFGD